MRPLTIEPAAQTSVRGFEGDTIVQRALTALDASRRWQITIKKEIPLAAGLGGAARTPPRRCGSATRSSNLRCRLRATRRRRPGRRGCAVLPCRWAAAGTGDGTELEALELPQDFTVLLLLPRGATKRRPQLSTPPSTAERARKGSSNGRRPFASPSPPSGARATSRSCPRTISLRPRSPRGSARSAPFAPTSPAPVPWSTDSSFTGPVHRPPRPATWSSGGPGSRCLRGTVERHVRGPGDRTWLDEFRPLAA